MSNPWGSGGMKYEGFVHQTLRTDVLIQFHPQFHEDYKDEDYAVSFQFNRTPLRRSHQAVDLAVKQPGFHVLFPTQLEKRAPQISLRKIKKSVRGKFVSGDLNDADITWINTSLNEEQRHAVLRILEGVHFFVNFHKIPQTEVFPHFRSVGQFRTSFTDLLALARR